MDNIKVLVVDDNSRIVNLLKDAITKETDMDVIATAADGEEDLKKSKSIIRMSSYLIL